MYCFYCKIAQKNEVNVQIRKAVEKECTKSLMYFNTTAEKGITFIVVANIKVAAVLKKVLANSGFEFTFIKETELPARLRDSKEYKLFVKIAKFI